MRSNKFTLLILALMCTMQLASAATLRGFVVDETTGEPLLGATVIIKGTTIGTSTGLDGDFSISLTDTSLPLVISYISYISQEITAPADLSDLTIKLAADTQMLASVEVVTKANMETEFSLQQQRMTSNVAIENIGVKEMSLKGLSNAEDGVKKMTGISIADAGQVVVRGLGDRYSITTLNGQPIASPNPDNKLIPLNIFPSAAISGIQVSKVYDAKAYADYAGAHIDISTKSLVYDNFFEVGVTVGGNTQTTGQSFRQMDSPSIFSKSSVASGAYSNKENFGAMSTYINENDAFSTNFLVTESNALPKMAANVAWGHKFDLGLNEFTVMATGSVDNDYQTIEDGVDAQLRSDGSMRSEFTYSGYNHSLKLAGLATAGLKLQEKGYINYTLFYARNAENEFQTRRGWTYDVEDLVGISSVSKVYGLINNQLHGEHYLSNKLELNYNISYSSTSSDEPDRRQVMYTDLGDGTYDLFKEDQNETMRYFAELTETDLNGQVATNFKFGTDNKNILTTGVAYKTKKRSFDSMSFYYNYGKESSGGFVEPEITDIFSPDFLSFDNIGYGTGEISLTYERYPNDYYDAYSNVLSAFASVDLNLTEKFLLTAGLRLESSEQSVDYGTESSTTRLNKSIKANDLFPALNMRYKVGTANQIRFSASRTITRPSFVEMAPFSYEPSYGSGIVKGNENIQNAYNYNVDLRYEMSFDRGDLFSLTGYYKYLDTPIERIQLLNTTDPYTSFENADSGMAAGVEVEFRKTLSDSFKVSANATYMFTNVNLAEGAQTNDSRMLQGASPYLINADVIYSPTIKGAKPLSLILLYCYRAERIYSVGVDGLGDIMELGTSDLDFVASYKINDKFSVKMEIENLLSEDFVCEQIVPQNNDERIVVEHYKLGIGAKIGLSWKF
ncbi:MAG: TonB-dependent receptor [Rikenellaceae bacterium]